MRGRLRSTLAILLCGVFIASSGCAIIPFHHRAPSPPVLVPMEVTPDTIAVTPPSPPDTLERASRTPTHPHPHSSKPPSPADTNQHPDNPPTPPPPTQTTPDRSISIDMPESLRTQLEASYQTDLTSVQKTVSLLAERPLAQVDHDKLQNVTGLLSQAQAAFDQQDLQGAANLVHKARVLADEIASH